MRVMIIEDELMIALLIEDCISDINCTASEIVDTEVGAIEAAASTRPDLIIADEHLREGSGVLAVQQICKTGAVPVVYISGAPHAGSMHLDHGVIIGKPFTAAKLLGAIAEAVDRVRPA